MAQHHKGTRTFILQRASAVLLIPLAAWFLIGVVSHLGADAEAARRWLSSPVNGGLAFLFIAVGALHMRIGMSEIIADYIHSWANSVLNVLNWLAALALIALTGWAIFFAG